MMFNVMLCFKKILFLDFVLPRIRFVNVYNWFSLRGSMPTLYPLFFNNLQDNIPSVRQGAALALANVLKAYGESLLLYMFRSEAYLVFTPVQHPGSDLCCCM